MWLKLGKWIVVKNLYFVNKYNLILYTYDFIIIDNNLEIDAISC